MCLLVINEAAVKYNGRNKLQSARIFYIRLLYYDDNTPGCCIMMIIHQSDVKVHQADVKLLNKKAVQLERIFSHLMILHD